MENFESSVDFDVQLKKVPGLRFLPFVGKKFSTASPRIMVLGESHYQGSEDEAHMSPEEHLSFTRDIVSGTYLQDIQPDGTHPTSNIRCFRYTAAMITGREYHDSDSIWEKLAFSNFFQDYVGVSPKDKSKIGDPLIEKSREVYLKVLSILKPDLVIAWGKGLLYTTWVPQEECDPDDKERKF